MCFFNVRREIERVIREAEVRDGKARFRDGRLCFLMERLVGVGGTERVFEAFSPLIHTITNPGHQHPIPSLPPFELLDGGAKFPLNCSNIVLRHALTKLHPRLRFYCCLRSLTGQKGAIGLLLYFDGIP